MVGFRVFDVGLLIVWLIWFFRLRDDDDDSRGDDGGGGEGGAGNGRGGPGGGGIRPRLGRRDEAGCRTTRGRPEDRRRDHEPRRRPPARVIRPSSPVPTHRRVA